MQSSSIRKPAALIGVAITLFLLAYIVPSRHNSRPLVLAIPTNIGEIVSPRFKVDQTLTYLVDLEVDRTLPFEQLTCLLGESSIAQHECGDTAQVVNLRWQVESNGSHIASGQSAANQGAGFGPTIEKMMGSFEGVAGRDYTLEVQVLGDMEALKAARPRVVVQLHPIDTKGTYLVSALLQLIALLLATTAVLWFAINTYRAAASKRGA